MGSQLRWLERTPDKREVGGSSPLEPTKFWIFSDLSSCAHNNAALRAEIENYLKIKICTLKTEQSASNSKMVKTNNFQGKLKTTIFIVEEIT